MRKIIGQFKVRILVDINGLLSGIKRNDSTALYIAKETLKDKEVSEEMKNLIKKALKDKEEKPKAKKR